MSYTANELNTKIQLQRYTITHDPETNAPIKEWATYAESFAKVEPLVGREYFAAQAAQSEATLKVTIRWNDAVTRRDRLLMRGKAYEITSVQNIRWRNRELLLYVQSLEADG